MVRLLLEHGADPNLPESDCPRGHALWIASYRKNVEMARLLLEYGADPNGSVESGGQVLVHARENPELYQLLVDHGAEVREAPRDRLHNAISDDDLEETEQILEEHPELLLEHGADIDAVDEEYCSTPLGLAARAGHLELVEFLLERGANPMASGAVWATPLAWARKRGHEEIEQQIEEAGGRS